MCNNFTGERLEVLAEDKLLLKRNAYAATATPPGISGLALIRMAGKSAFEIGEEVFEPIGKKTPRLSEMEGYTCSYGKIYDPLTKETIDNVILTKFVGPNSYTGEDTVEISCHGGLSVKQRILELLFSRGARPALPGEFSKNAFLNGKLDLAQAQAVMDLISSRARLADRQAISILDGKLSEKIHKMNSAIYKLLSHAEMNLEFPEHEDDLTDEERFGGELTLLMEETRSLIDSYRQGRILKEGFTVVFAGKPNAGKSSMLNALAGQDRVIVTDIPGTTRDTVEEWVQIEGLPVRLIDTAGLRETEDKVEKIGVERAKTALRSADLLLWLIDDDYGDSLESIEAEYKELLSGTDQQVPAMALIISKTDLLDERELAKKIKDAGHAFPDLPVVPVSVVTEQGLDLVKDLIVKIYHDLGSASSDELLISNERQIHILSRALAELNMTHEGILAGLPADIWVGALRKAAESLAEITGDDVGETLVNEIFSEFCVGK